MTLRGLHLAVKLENATLSRGAFVGDFNAIFRVGDPCVKLRAASDDAEVYLIARADFKSFSEKYPGIFVQFIDRTVIL